MQKHIYSIASSRSVASCKDSHITTAQNAPASFAGAFYPKISVATSSRWHWLDSGLAQGSALKQLPGLDPDNILIIWTMVERHDPDSFWTPFWCHLPDHFNTGARLCCTGNSCKRSRGTQNHVPHCLLQLMTWGPVPCCCISELFYMPDCAGASLICLNYPMS